MRGDESAKARARNEVVPSDAAEDIARRCTGDTAGKEREGARECTTLAHARSRHREHRVASFASRYLQVLG